MESEETTRQYEVYQNITSIDLNQQVQGIISPREYKYYVTRIWNVRTDILVTINRFFGLTDIFLSAHTMRIVESNLTSESAASSCLPACWSLLDCFHFGVNSRGECRGRTCMQLD